MNEPKPAVDICKDPRPGSAEGRLAQALAAVEAALGCLDLKALRWTPVGADYWDRAGSGLAQVREELKQALAVWQTQRNQS